MNAILLQVLLLFLVQVSFLNLISIFKGDAKKSEFLWMSPIGSIIFTIIVSALITVNYFTYHAYAHTPTMFLIIAGVFIIKEIILFLIDLFNDSNTIATLRFITIIIIAIFFIYALAIPAWSPEKYSNDITYQLWNEDRISGFPEDYITVETSGDIRVVPWDIAGAYIQRSYADESARLSTTTSDLAVMTDPTIFNGQFVWVNIPKFETLKWVGGKDIPFFSFVPNSDGEIQTRLINTTISINREKMSWSQRIDEILYRDYSQYHDYQIRSDVDDEGNPYHIVYLTQKDNILFVQQLEKILIIDAHTGEYKEYDINDSDIPDWLEVVYPDKYVFRYVSWWSANHRYWVYRTFNKKGMYQTTDNSARFLKLGNTTYWQILIRHQTSDVLAGYVMVNTRTGDLKFYDRSSITRYDEYNQPYNVNYVTRGTAGSQVIKYLQSGEAGGYKQLAVHEGYLYPVQTGENITERYFFPCYAGLSLKKIAIVDPVDYRKVIIADNLEEAVRYVISTDDTHNWTQGTYSIENIAMVEDKIIVQINGTTYSVIPEQLSYGEINNEVEEWNNLNLAFYRWLSGRDAEIWVTIVNDNIVDVVFGENT